MILKVGGSSTPEHSIDSPLASNYSVTQTTGDEESMHSVGSFQQNSRQDDSILSDKSHKKLKKKKKKKDKDKDKDKHDKKKKHHKRKKVKDESSQDDVSLLGDESLLEPPTKKLMSADHDNSSFDLLDTNYGDASPNRNSRSCVARQRQEKTSFQKLLDHIHRCLEKRDAQQFFAWPVTDNIAPGYSAIISHPMDFSTMKQKIDDDIYSSLQEYIEDFKLMCGNAMVYNHPDTIYFKAAKRLLHAGVKLTHPDKIRPLRTVLPFMSEIPRHQLGFDVGSEENDDVAMDKENSVDTPKEVEKPNGDVKPVRRGPNYLPESKFEAIPDDLTPDELLTQCQKAAADAADKLAKKKPNTKMGFLRQSKDGTTSLAIIVPNDGIDPETNERPISLGALVGKLNHGTGSLQGFREDRRNLTKPVKPLYYGAFGSYAPSYDSTFANLSKEESDLVYQTYGDDTSVQYAESILNFAKDSDYTLTMVDNLLDLLTGGEHRKTKKIIDEKRKFREEEEKIKQLMESKPAVNSANNGNVKVELSQLKTLSDLGIDTSFLNSFDNGDFDVQERLDKTNVLIDRLHQVQSERLSAPPPPHLAHVPAPNETECILADKITGSLSDLAKRVPPGAIASVPGVRKAMGVAIEPPVRPVESIERTETSPAVDSSPAQNTPVTTASNGCISVEGGPGDVVVGVDLESELREFLESDPALSSFPLHDDVDDNTIEQMLCES
nr:PREDICTED: bromodomain-containing protein 7 [Bemisia tabaci]